MNPVGRLLNFGVNRCRRASGSIRPLAHLAVPGARQPVTKPIHRGQLVSRELLPVGFLNPLGEPPDMR
jgi:hypothetical protein